tara:strand:- start:1177 stop:1587 length:411 start_codon:yes stop_codon:yes gene_type:complete
LGQIEEEALIEELGCRFEIVVRGKNEAALLGEFTKQASERLGGVPIETSKGLIEEEDMGFLGESPGQEGSLLLPPRELTDLTITEISNAQRMEGLLNGLMVFVCVAFPQANMRVSSHFYQAAHSNGEVPVDVLTLG